MKNTKDTIRSNLIDFRSRLTNTLVSKANLDLNQQLSQYISHQSSVTLLAAYYPFQNELSVLETLSNISHKQYAFPRFDEKKNSYEMAIIQSLTNDFIVGKFNCYEAKPECPICETSSISHWLIPGLAFDKKGNRLGFGAGIYDRLLENTKGLKIGICYDEQIVKHIPNEPHDQIMDVLITPNEIIKI